MIARGCLGVADDDDDDDDATAACPAWVPLLSLNGEVVVLDELDEVVATTPMRCACFVGRVNSDLT